MPSTTTSAIDVALNHNVTAVGQPTDQTPDTFSIVDTTEKVVDPEIVDSSLLPGQRNTDKRPTTEDLGEVKPSPQQTMDNECYYYILTIIPKILKTLQKSITQPQKKST